jgi:EAL domain-containing protein (putative c-di-GMP-specific phosphodiesterase class I)
VKSIKNALEDQIVTFVSVIFVTLILAAASIIWNYFSSGLFIIYFSILLVSFVIIFVLSYEIIITAKKAGNEIRNAINQLERETNNFGSNQLDNDKSEISIEELSLLENTFHNLLARFASIGRISEEDLIPLEIKERIKSHLPLTKGEFNQTIYYLLRSNQSYRSAYMLVQIKNFNSTFRNDLIDHIQSFFKNAIIGEYSDDTLSVFLPEIDSISLLKSRIRLFYSSFASATVDKNRENIAIADIRVSAVIYPYSGRRDLERDADFALRKTKNYIVYIPQRRNKGLARYENIENISRLFLLNSEPIFKEMRETKDFKSFYDFLKNNLLKFARQFGYMNAGFLLLNPSHEFYDVYFEDTRMNSPATFRRLDNIPVNYLAPIFEEAGDDHCLYGDSSDPLPPKLSSILDNLNISSFFFQTIVDDDKTNLGLLYLCSSEKSLRPLSVSEQTILIFISALFEQLVRQMREVHQDKRRDSLLEHILKINEEYVYIVDKRTRLIHYVSQNLASYFPGKTLVGQKCYKVFRNRDEICQDCPLSNKEPVIIINEISPSPLQARVLNYTGNPNEETIVLKVPSRENLLSNALFVDKDLSIKNRARLIADIREALYTNHRGFILGIRLAVDDSEINPSTKDDNLSFLNAISQSIIEAGYENVLFRIDDDALAINFIEASRPATFNRLEDIYKHIAIKAHRLSDRLSFNLTLLEYPTDCNDAIILDKTINDGFNKSAKVGKNILYIIRNRVSRPADRNAYILNFYETANSRNYWESYVQPLINLDNEFVTGGEMLLRLYDPNRAGFIPPNDFVDLYSDNRLMCDQEKTIIRRVGEMWRSLGYTLFRSRGIDRISVNISFDTIINKDFHGFLSGVINQYKFPTNFLQLEIDEDIAMLHQDEVRAFIKRNSDLKISFILDNYTGRNLSPNSINSLGFHYLKLEQAAIRSIENDSDSYVNFTHMVNRLKTLNLELIVKGVETERQVNIIKSLGVHYCEGYFYAKPMPIDDYEKYIVSTDQQTI